MLFELIQSCRHFQSHSTPQTAPLPLEASEPYRDPYRDSYGDSYR